MDVKPTKRLTDSPVVAQWERTNWPSWRKALAYVWSGARRGTRMVTVVFFAFAVGFAAASGPPAVSRPAELHARLQASSSTMLAQQGELELARLELGRLNTVIQNSARYRIPADLAAKIYDVAVAEGIDPKVAFSLVNVESDFANRAVSSKGALGLTQVMPSTARFFEPRIERSDLFDPDTNLRIGFRFLKELIAKYDGDIDLALHAYNRGPDIVDRVMARGGNPANGYADAIKRGTQ